MSDIEHTRPHAIVVTDRFGLSLADGLPAEIRTSAYAITSGSWLGIRYFDRAGICHTVVAVKPAQPLGTFQRILAATIYNPTVAAAIGYGASRSYSLDELGGILIEAVERDDDVLTQWHSSATLIQMIRAAATFDDLTDVVRFADTPSEDEESDDDALDS